MAIIKSFSSFQNLSNFSSFIVDRNPNSDFFRITEFKESFTGGKNGFLIEGSEFLKETTEVKIEILDVEGNPIYYEPGKGTPEYYEGLSTLVSVHVYPDTPIGIGKITVLGELKEFINENGTRLPIPTDWKGVYNVKWEKTFKINRNLANEDTVRFYRRPVVSITELVKPIFSLTIPSVTQTGSLEGLAIQPSVGSDLTNWRAGTNYKLKITDNSNWTASVDESTVNVPALGYSPVIREVLNNKEVLVDIPYSIGNRVQNFTSTPYSTTFDFLEGQVINDSALTGSFAKINISNLKTFVGDVARVKVFRKSRNEVTDFQFVQESKLESSELLRDITTANTTEISYGNFSETNLTNYWVTSSNSHPVSINVDILQASVKTDYNFSAGEIQRLITSESFVITKDVEYTLTFKTLISGSLNGSETLRGYLSASDGYQQTFLTVSGSDIFKTRQIVSQNIIANPISSSDAKLVFDISGSDWYISNVSLKNAQETSFSPDEFLLIQDIPRKLGSETFDFRFEFYDINNNYIPVDVNATQIFDGGNDFPTSGKLLNFESDRNAFRFSTGSIGNPPFQQIQFKTTTQNLVGEITFNSAAFDTDGNFIEPSSYLGNYPGFLTNITPAGALLTIGNFSGSDETKTIGSIVYTASLDGVDEFETIFRLEDGENAPQLVVSSNANQFIYEPTTLAPKPSGQSITIRAQRKNLASLVTPLTINSSSNSPLTFVDTLNGIDTFTISALQFSASFANNTFPEITYQFTGSDIFGNKQSDEITISPVINFDGISLVLSNESTTFPALSTGVIVGGLAASSGSVQMFIGGNQILHDDIIGGRLKNTFDITSVVGSGVTPTSTSPINEFYSISAMSADSGSLTLNIEYLAGDSVTTQTFQKVVSYTKAKRGVPNVEVSVTPTAQSIQANSLGSGSAVPQTLNVTALEGGVNRFTGFGTIVSTNGLTINNTNPPLITFTSNAGSMTSDTGTITIPVNFTDSENISGTKNVIASVSRVRSSIPVVNISATPQAQSVVANAAGVQTGTLTNVTIQALEGSTSRFTSMIISSTGFSTPPTISGNTLVMTSAVMNSDEGSVTLTVTHTDSEGTSNQTKTIVVRTTKVKVGDVGATGATGAVGANGTNGTNGTNGAVGGDGRRTAFGMVHFQTISANQPSAPSATSFTFSTATFTGLTAGYGTGTPTYESGNSNKYWYANYTAVESSAGSNTAVPTFGAVTQAIGFSGLVTFSSTNKITDGTNILENIPSGSITNHIGGPGVTTILGDKISTGIITSSGFATTDPDNGQYMLAGTIFNLNNGSLRSKNFFINSAGDAFFKGNITGATGTFSGIVSGATLTGNTITGGSIAIGAGSPSPFSVDSAGNVVANSATIGGWSVNNGGIFRTQDGSTIRLNSTNNKIQMLEGDATTGTPRFDVSTGDTIPIVPSGTFIDGPRGVFISRAGFAVGRDNQRYFRNVTIGETPLAGKSFVFNDTKGGFRTDILTFHTPVLSDNYFKFPIDSGRTGLDNDALLPYQLVGGVPNPSVPVWMPRTPEVIMYDRPGDPPEGYQQGSQFANTIGLQSGGGATIAGTTFRIHTGTVEQLENDYGSQVLPLRFRIDPSGDVQILKELKVFGNIIAFATSDERLKENITPISDSLEKINKLNGVQFDWKEGFKDIHNLNGHDVGLLAHEVEEVLPEIVTTRHDGYKAIQYEKVVPLLVECIKELKKEIEELKKNK